MKEVRLAIAVPCCRDMKAAFASSMIGLTRQLSTKGVNGVILGGFDINIMQGASVLPKARQTAVDWAKKGNFTHLLCIDDDMQFPANILDGLFANDVDVVACNYVSKATKNPLTHGVNGEMIFSKDRMGIEEAGWVGFGLVLIKLDSIREIPAPLFETRWLEERKDFMGEDFYFCMKARSHGLRIYIDHDASAKISHIGDHYYKEAA